MLRRLFAFTICAFCFTISASAHPGKTDANGGHYDHSTGEYHYHHGYPAHQHPNGICPYAAVTDAESSETSKMTFAELWNEGYLCARDDEIDATDPEYQDVVRDIFNSLYDENQMDTDDMTYPEDVGYSNQDAFDDGYNQALFDYENLSYEESDDHVIVDGELLTEEEYEELQEREAQENGYSEESPETTYDVVPQTEPEQPENNSILHKIVIYFSNFLYYIVFIVGVIFTWGFFLGAPIKALADKLKSRTKTK